MLRLQHNFIVNKDRGAGFNSTACEEEQLQGTGVKGKTAEVDNCCSNYLLVLHLKNAGLSENAFARSIFWRAISTNNYV